MAKSKFKQPISTSNFVYRIEARISGKSFFLKIDSLSTQAIVNSGKVSEFRPKTEEKLFIGGTIFSNILKIFNDY